MKVLTLDIETSPNVADVWGLFNQNVSLSQLRESTRVICFAAKWRGEPKVEFRSEFHDGRDEMIRRAHALLDEAQVTVTYNGRSFDLPNLRREFLLAGLTPPSPTSDIDLYRVVKSRFRFASGKLDHVAQQLGLGAKAKHEGHELWVRCLAGDEKAWRRMAAYNRQDVRLTERLYERLIPWVKGHPHAGLMSGVEEAVCPRCGSSRLQKRGFAYTPLGVYQQYACQGCGSWSRGGKRLGFVETRGVE